MKKQTSFHELINGEKPVMIDFSAEWCGPCKAMQPILKEVATAIGDEATIVKIDVDQNQGLANQLGIRGVPTFILYQHGQMVWRQSGMQSAAALKEVIQSGIHKHKPVIPKSLKT